MIKNRLPNQVTQSYNLLASLHVIPEQIQQIKYRLQTDTIVKTATTTTGSV